MALETRNSGVVRFATFQVDLRSGEVRKQGAKIKLQEQPFRVLKVLLQRPGEVVTREELRSQNWLPDTFVDFENSRIRINDQWRICFEWADRAAGAIKGGDC